MSEFELPLKPDGAGAIVDAAGNFVLAIAGRRLLLEDENRALAFVALACNCHDDLVKALRNLYNDCRNVPMDDQRGEIISEHTKGEAKYIEERIVVGGITIARIAKRGRTEIEVADGERLAKCWDCHDDLVEACEKLLGICERFGYHDVDCAALGCTCGLRDAKAALAKDRQGS